MCHTHPLCWIAETQLQSLCTLERKLIFFIFFLMLLGMIERGPVFLFLQSAVEETGVVERPSWDSRLSSHSGFDSGSLSPPQTCLPWSPWGREPRGRSRWPGPRSSAAPTSPPRRLYAPLVKLSPSSSSFFFFKHHLSLLTVYVTGADRDAGGSWSSVPLDCLQHLFHSEWSGRCSGRNRSDASHPLAVGGLWIFSRLTL